ncbi:aminopeptidase N [Aliidiomarina minuta]|uniref:Aminopeptidase N n=1 Tax=Aliidiomarina minuta TaxID=880057 RepID=A0A432W6L1_9GAMM|nr:aminopeptidase N [Aliidiomarina minuta]RUO25714.1 aminopeptidase N [Aliidiomarina minuta]
MTTMPQAKYRKDYQTPDYTIDEVDLDIRLQDHQTLVSSRLTVRRQGEHNEPLRLDGEALKLINIELDGEVLSEHRFQVVNNQLQIDDVPEAFELLIITQLDPANNSALEGLYKSGGAFCTQCEAEGFRRITYYLDRPDVLAVFTTRLQADKDKYPYLLANGNKTDSGELENGQHWVSWHDPHPKPCYLFAVVAGDFDLLEDSYRTKHGRDVALQLFVDKGNLGRAEFAMRSLKAAMKWDEVRFNLVYDLDIYMIVAVDFFNMGAMENKGLNVFNAKYVLADAKTATDQDFLNVESVIGHEYFHNWTGNRITCRDWFQLSLKEGLTVFRDQEFSGDMSMRPVHRIQDVRIMRTHQFHEDSSPMAHPIRPDKVIEMNNFYTVTVYNKGAEVIRMLHSLLDEQGFQKGMQLYVERHDGQAVTCEDFVCAMEDANSTELRQFRRWYEQAGTPVLSITESYDASAERYTLHCRQHTAATPGQKKKQAFHIPLRVHFYSDSGELLKLTSDELKNDILQLTEEQQDFVFEKVKEKPVPGLLAGFSAPVKLDYEYQEKQLLTLLAYSQDPFICWDAAQQVYLQAMKKAIAAGSPVQLSQASLDALKHKLENQQSDPALVSLLLQIPSEESLSGEYDVIPVADIHRVCGELKQLLASELEKELKETYSSCHPQGAYQFAPTDIAQRMLANTCLAFLANLKNPEITALLERQFSKADNMTDELAAMQAAVHANHTSADNMLREFAAKWQSNSLVMDKWLATQASAARSSTLDSVKQLTSHGAFSWQNPNRIYSLVATFTHNLAQLHREDGEGYRWLREVIVRLNSSNPQVASRLVTALLQWRRFDEKRQTLLKQELKTLQELPDLASDLYEKVEQSLQQD